MTREKKKQSKKDALAKYGLFVVHPVNLTLLMTDAEYKLLDAIRHYVNNNHPVSNSLLEVTHRITNAKSIAKNKVNLIKLDFIKVLSETQKGIYYTVLYNNISEILCQLNNEINPIRRLEIADCYRVNHGLDALNTNAIRKYKGTNFDTTFCNIESSNTEIEGGCYESKDAQYLNEQLQLLENNLITKRVYQMRVNKFKENNNKLKFIDNQWIQTC